MVVLAIQDLLRRGTKPRLRKAGAGTVGTFQKKTGGIDRCPLRLPDGFALQVGVNKV